MRRVDKFYPFLTIPLLLAIGVGCDFKTQNESLSFSDSESSVETVDTVHGVLAQQAYIDIEVCCGEIQVVRPLDPAVIDIISTGVSTFQIQGKAPGTASIYVETSEGEGTVRVEVGAIAATELNVQPWSPDFELPATLFEEGAVILPNSPVRFQASMYDGQGRPLVGYGLPQAMLAPGSPGSLEAHDDGQYTFRSIDELGHATILLGSATLDLEVIDPERVSSLSVFDYSAGVETSVSSAIDMTAEAASILHLVLRDDENRYVIGAGNPSIAVHAEDGEFSTIITGTGEDDTDPLGRSLTRARALMLIPAHPGIAYLDVAVAGLEATLECDVQ